MRHITRCDGINSIFKFRQIFLFRWLVAVRWRHLRPAVDVTWQRCPNFVARACRATWPCLAHKTHIATWIVLLAYENFTMLKCWMIMCEATLCADAKRCFSTMFTSYLCISPTYEQIHVWVCLSLQNHRGIWYTLRDGDEEQQAHCFCCFLPLLLLLWKNFPLLCVH